MKASDLPRTPLTLISGPAGSGKTSLALELIRSSATRSAEHGDAVNLRAHTLLVLPTYAQVMHTKRVALSRWGARGILDAPFVTFTAAAERYLPSFRIHSLPSLEERDRFMAKALADADDPYFESVEDLAGVRERLLLWLKELKQSGASLDAIADDMVEASASLHPSRVKRVAACMAVFRAYGARLGKAGLIDHEDMLRALAEALAREPHAGVPSLLVVDGFDDVSPVEFSILAGLSNQVCAGGGHVVMTLPWDPHRPALFRPSATTRARLLGIGFKEYALKGTRRGTKASLHTIADHLFDETLTNAAPSASEGSSSVLEIVASGEADEAERIASVLRSAYTKRETLGVRGWRDVGIVLRDVGDRTALLRRALQRRGIPHRIVGRGEPLAASPWMRACRGPLAILGGASSPPTFDAHALNTWLHWRLSWPSNSTGSPQQAESDRGALREFELSQRRNSPPTSFDAYRRRAPACLEQALNHLTACAVRCGEHHGSAAIFRVVAEALHELVPIPAGGEVSESGEIIDLKRDVVGAWARAAHARLSTLLGSLARTAVRTEEEASLTCREAFTQIDDAISRSEVTRVDQRLDAVSILSAEDARFWELPFVVVAGLESGTFPRSPAEDLFLSDDERVALTHVLNRLHLPTTASKQDRERRLFYGAVTRAKHTLVLSRAGFDDRGSPRAPSLYLEHVRALVSPTLVSSPDTDEAGVLPLHSCHTRVDLMRHASATLVDAVGARALPDASVRPVALARALLSHTAPDVLASLDVARGPVDPTRPLATPLAVPAQGSPDLAPFVAATACLSASALGKAVTCLHQFWFARVLRLPEDELSFEAQPFDARGIGTALHAAAERALRHPKDSPRAVAEHVLQWLPSQGLAVPPIDAHLLSGELERVVTLLRDRTSDATFRPQTGWLERRFGSDEPVALGIVSLRGQIDRVDKLARRVIVVDYKSSASGCDRAAKKSSAHEDLQLPLYALVLEALDDVEVVGLEWVALKERTRRVIGSKEVEADLLARREAKAVDVREKEAFRALLEGAKDHASNRITAIRSGDHTKNPGHEDACAQCAYVAICRFSEPRSDANESEAEPS